MERYEQINDEKTLDEIIKWARITNEVILPALIEVLIELKKNFKEISKEIGL